MPQVPIFRRGNARLGVDVSKGLRAGNGACIRWLRSAFWVTVLAALLLAGSQPTLGAGEAVSQRRRPGLRCPQSPTTRCQSPGADPGDSSITGYQVLRRNPAIHDSGVFDVIQDDTGSSDTSYTDTTVAPETTYRYRVKARNAHGLSERSEPAKRFTTPAAPTPAAPTPANSTPTGLPTITGTARVGETLSADTSRNQRRQWADRCDLHLPVGPQ